MLRGDPKGVGVPPDATVSGRRLPVRGLLSLLVLAALLPALGLAAMLGFRFAAAERTTIEQTGLDAARGLASAVDRQIGAIEASLVALGTSPALEIDDVAAFHRQAVRLRAVARTEIVLTDGTGRQLANTRRPYGEPLPALNAPEPYRLAAAENRRIVTGVFAGTLAGRPIVLVVVPVRLGPDRRPGALAASVDTESFWSPLLRTTLEGLPYGAITVLVDAEQTVLARDPAGITRVGERVAPDFVARLVAARASGAAEGWIDDQRTREGRPVRVAWRSSGSAGWSVLVALPEAAINGPLREALWPLLTGGGVLLLLGLGLAQRLSRGLAAALQRLAADASQPHPPSGVVEVDALAAALTAASSRRVVAEDALRGNEARLRLALDHARLGDFRWDARTATVSFSAQGAAILGLSPGSEVLDDATRYGIIHPDDREAARGAFSAALAERTDYAAEFRVRRPVDGREVWVAALGRARYGADGDPLDVIGVIQDVTARKAAETAVRSERDRAQRYFEATRTALIVLDPRFALREINGAGLALVGGTRETVLGLPWAETFVPEAHRERVRERLAGFAAGGELPPLYEGVLQRLDGEWRRVDWRTITLKDAEGRFCGLFSAGEDVTEQRAAAERQTLLAREVDHRARNALSVVLAILRLTRADTVKGYARSVEGRIAALARAHALLAEERWRAADLRMLLEQELAPFAEGAATISVTGPSVAIRPTAVQAVAMAFHELATNAAKYGALSTPSGALDVGWAEDADGTLVVDWTERDGPPIAATPTRRGFGTRVLEATVREQLDGRLELRWNPTGLVASLRIPRQHLIAAAA